MFVSTDAVYTTLIAPCPSVYGIKQNPNYMERFFVKVNVLTEKKFGAFKILT
jgi:hypothetical protein